MEDITTIRQWMIDVLSKPKKNYHDACLKTIEGFSSFPAKPRLLLHVCCGPCSCYPLLFLAPHFDVSILYNNSNIYPEAEFDRRLGELKRLLRCLEEDYGYHYDLIVPPYDNESFTRFLSPYAEEKERGARCKICYQKRMEEAYDYADEHGFDYFCTVMTVSREKSSAILNAIGEELEKGKAHKAKYFYSDFKKDDGIAKGKKIREKYGLYYQNYCGCVYSLKTRLEFDEKSRLEEKGSKGEKKEGAEKVEK